jgi:carbon monoxide dehydrogenase subunit G
VPTLRRTITTNTPAERVFPYLADFTNATEWDSGTVSCERVSGDGGPGTVYRNVSKFMGREVELEYTVERADAPVVALVGRQGGTTSRDTITVNPSGGGSVVEYEADFEFSGPAKLLGPLIRIPLERLAAETERTLKEALDRL